MGASALAGPTGPHIAERFRFRCLPWAAVEEERGQRRVCSRTLLLCLQCSPSTDLSYTVSAPLRTSVPPKPSPALLTSGGAPSPGRPSASCSCSASLGGSSAAAARTKAIGLRPRQAIIASTSAMSCTDAALAAALAAAARFRAGSSAAPMLDSPSSAVCVGAEVLASGRSDDMAIARLRAAPRAVLAAGVNSNKQHKQKQHKRPRE